MTHKECNHIYFEEQCCFLTVSRASSFLGVFPAFHFHPAFPVAAALNVRVAGARRRCCGSTEQQPGGEQSMELPSSATVLAPTVLG